MRIKEQEARDQLAKKIKKENMSPLAKEIETRRENLIRGILENSVGLVNKQMEVASLPVTPYGKDNDTVLKATNSLLDRAFGKAKESIDLNTTVKFSLRELSKQADEMELLEAEIIE